MTLLSLALLDLTCDRRVCRFIVHDFVAEIQLLLWRPLLIVSAGKRIRLLERQCFLLTTLLCRSWMIFPSYIREVTTRNLMSGRSRTTSIWILFLSRDFSLVCVANKKERNKKETDWTSMIQFLTDVVALSTSWSEQRGEEKHSCLIETSRRRQRRRPERVVYMCDTRESKNISSILKISMICVN